MHTTIEISEDTFAKTYRPIKNHFCDASFDWGAGFGTMFDIAGPDLEFVMAQDPDRIWTLCIGDDADFIASGYHFAYNLGYFVTEVPVPADLQIQITLPMIDDNGDEIYGH